MDRNQWRPSHMRTYAWKMAARLRFNDAFGS
jgi:hypothetical protein